MGLARTGAGLARGPGLRERPWADASRRNQRRPEMTLPDLRRPQDGPPADGSPACWALLTLAPAAEAQGYNIRPGDVLRIEVIEDPTLNRSVLVPPDGKHHRAAGRIGAGRRARGRAQVQSRSRARLLAPNFAAAPSVFVSIEQIAQAGRRRAPAAAADADRHLRAGRGRQSRPARGRARHHGAAALRRDGRLLEIRRDQAHPAAPDGFRGPNRST